MVSPRIPGDSSIHSQDRRGNDGPLVGYSHFRQDLRPVKENVGEGGGEITHVSLILP